MLHDVLLTAIIFLTLDRHHREKDKFLYVQYPYPHHGTIHARALPPVPPNHARVVVISDTHERHEGICKLPPCDLFIHCGDILMLGRLSSEKTALKKLMKFNQWLSGVPAKKRIVVAGNHDKPIATLGKEKTKEILSNCEYLENEGTSYGKLRIWGTPWSSGNSGNTAFQSEEFHSKVKTECPEEVDILITHGTIGDLEQRVKHRIHFCGHNHNSYGVSHKPAHDDTGLPRVSLCAPVHDGHYRLRHLPMIIDIPYEAFQEQATVESFQAMNHSHSANHGMASTEEIIDLEDERSRRSTSSRSLVEQVLSSVGGKSSRKIRPM